MSLAHSRVGALLLGVQRRSYLPRCTTRPGTTLCLIQTFASLLAPNQSWEGMDGFILSGHVRPTPGYLARWCGRERETQG